MSLYMSECIHHRTKRPRIWTGHIHIGTVTVTAGFCSEKCLEKQARLMRFCIGCYGERDRAVVEFHRM